MSRKKRKNDDNVDFDLPNVLDPTLGPNLTNKDLFGNPLNLQPFTSKDYDMLMKKTGKKKKKLSGGRSKPYMPGYKYKTPKSKKHKAGDQVPANQDVTTPNGEHWQKKSKQVTARVRDYEQSDVFSDFNGNFFLEKVGNHYHCWIQIVSSNTINGNGESGDSSSVAPGKKICDKTWDDNTGKKAFALSSIAAHFAKHNIYEDGSKDGSRPLHAYHDVNMGCGDVKYWNIIDGGYNQGKAPHKIAHAGETIVIDTARMKVYKTDGTDLTKYTSFESLFPPLYGGQFNNVNFYPTVGDKCDVNIMYVPRIK